MSNETAKSKIGKFAVISIIIYVLSLNWPIMKWVYSLQQPPHIVYVLGFPFAMFWATLSCLAMLAIWTYVMLTTGENIVNNAEKNVKLKSLSKE